MKQHTITSAQNNTKLKQFPPGLVEPDHLQVIIYEKLMQKIAYSLGARDEFIQPIFYKRFERFSLKIRQNGLKKQWSA